MRVKAVAAPAERCPERAIGERLRLRRIVRQPLQLRARAGGVDDQVEGAKLRPSAATSVARCPVGIDASSSMPVSIAIPRRLGRAKQHAKQRGAMHGEPEAAALLRVVAHVEHGAAARARRRRSSRSMRLPSATMSASSPRSSSTVRPVGCRISPEPTGAGFVEALEDGDAMPGPLQIERRRQARRPCPGDRYVENLACHPTPADPGTSGSAAAKSSRGARA